MSYSHSVPSTLLMWVSFVEWMDLLYLLHFNSFPRLPCARLLILEGRESVQGSRGSEAGRQQDEEGEGCRTGAAGAWAGRTVMGQGRSCRGGAGLCAGALGPGLL